MMIVSVRQRRKCAALMAIQHSYDDALAGLKRNTEHLMLINSSDKDAIDFRRGRILRYSHLMELHAYRFEKLLKEYAEKYSDLYIDGDGIIWTCPPHEFGS